MCLPPRTMISRHASSLLLVAAALGIAASVGCGGSVSPEPTSSSKGPGAAPTATQADPAPSPTQPPAQPAQPAQPAPGTILGDYGYESPPGTYGAATVTAAAASASYDFQCMQGDSGAIVPDASGAFTAHGTLTTSGGRIQTISNVTFTGTVSGGAMTLTVTWPTTITTKDGTQPSTDTFGPVTLTKGVVPTRWPGCI